MNEKKLMPSEFELAISHLTRALKPANVEIVKAILVGGRKQSDMVVETKLSRTAIAAMTKKVRDAYRLHGRPPEGWERIELCVPASMVPVLRAMEDEIRKQLTAKSETETCCRNEQSDGEESQPVSAVNESS